MHRFYVPSATNSGSSLTLTGREAHHALQVLRLRCGERVAVLDGKGHEIVCDVQKADRRAVILAVLTSKFIPPPLCELTLAQAVLKTKAMDLVVQKATELGAHRIAPVLSERSVVHVGEDSAEARVEKWNMVAIETIKQCGAPWQPRIDPPKSLTAFLAQTDPFDLRLIAVLQEGGSIRNHLDQFRAKLQRAPRSICVWIGPEGDFTPSEIKAIETAGVLPIHLGPRVLRSETAAISALAILNYELLL